MALAAAIIIQDVLASRPAAAAAYEGVLFVVTDSAPPYAIQRCDGAAWITLAGGTTGELAVLTADPGSPANGTAWIYKDGSTPANVSLKVRDGGVTYDLPLGTLT